MIMHEIKGPTEDLQDQLNTAKEEIQSLKQELKCLLDLTKNAWLGDEVAIVHLGELIGIDPEIEQNAFSKKKTIPPSSAKKTVTIADNDEILSKHTTSTASSTRHEIRREQQQGHMQAIARNTYLQPFLKQNHIDPIREQNSRQLFNYMMRYRQNETRNPSTIPPRISSASGRPRVTKHLYQFASPDHVVRHLGTPSSRTKPYFVFAGKEFFQQTTNHAPLYEKAFITSDASRQSEHSDTSDELETIPSPTNEPVIARPQTAKSTQQSLHRSGARSRLSDSTARASSVASNGLNTRSTPLSERERRDAMLLQRQLNLPRQGWLKQHS